METKHPTRKSTGRKNVIIFGDSIAYGELISPVHGWVVQLGLEIEALHGDDFLLINSSINGNTTRIALERMPFDVQRYGVDVLVIQFGLNDCNFWQTDEGEPRVSLEAYRANLREMIGRGRRFGARQILLPTTHPTPHTALNEMAGMSYEANRRRYNVIVREVAAAEGCVLIDIEAAAEKVFGNAAAAASALLLPDGIHLNRAGHTFYFDAFKAPLLTSIAKCTKEDH